MSRITFRLVLAVLLAAPALAAPVAVSPTLANHDGNPTHDTFQKGDLFVAVGQGKVEWRFADGTLNRVLDTGATGFTTGMAFDAAGHLYVTNFDSNAVFEFDTSGNLVGPFGSGYNCDPESIVFNAEGDAYIGQADCSGDILKFNPAGGLRETYDVPIDDRGSDWIDLAADQCTLRYTSEGSRLLIERDTTAPISSVDPLPSSTRDSAITISVTASDDSIGPLQIQLFTRYRQRTTDPWGSWGVAADQTFSSGPYTFLYPFANGKGFYEFYSVATDAFGNREASPSVADTWIQKR